MSYHCVCEHGKCSSAGAVWGPPQPEILRRARRNSSLGSRVPGVSACPVWKELRQAAGAGHLEEPRVHPGWGAYSALLGELAGPVEPGLTCRAVGLSLWGRPRSAHGLFLPKDGAFRVVGWCGRDAQVLRLAGGLGRGLCPAGTPPSLLLHPVGVWGTFQSPGSTPPPAASLHPHAPHGSGVWPLRVWGSSVRAANLCQGFRAPSSSQSASGSPSHGKDNTGKGSASPLGASVRKAP